MNPRDPLKIHIQKKQKRIHKIHLHFLYIDMHWNSPLHTYKCGVNKNQDFASNLTSIDLWPLCCYSAPSPPASGLHQKPWSHIHCFDKSQNRLFINHRSWRYSCTASLLQMICHINVYIYRRYNATDVLSVETFSNSGGEPPDTMIGNASLVELQ